VLVHTAGQTMKEIVDAVKSVTDIMGEIRIASAEQSSGIESGTLLSRKSIKPPNSMPP